MWLYGHVALGDSWEIHEPRHNEFGFAVSAYAFSAVKWLAYGGFADRLTEKLLLFFTRFILGTLFCGFANPTHAHCSQDCNRFIWGGLGLSRWLLLQTSSAGNVPGNGFFTNGFGASQVLGIIGLYIANLGRWQSPFIMIVLLAVLYGWHHDKDGNHHKHLPLKTTATHFRTYGIPSPKKLPHWFHGHSHVIAGGFMMSMGYAFAITPSVCLNNNYPVVDGCRREYVAHYAVVVNWATCRYSKSLPPHLFGWSSWWLFTQISHSAVLVCDAHEHVFGGHHESYDTCHGAHVLPARDGWQGAFIASTLPATNCRGLAAAVGAWS